MSGLLATKHAISQMALDLGAKEILNAKKNNEINKSGVTYMRESAKIKAQIQSIINDVQKRVYEIIKLNKQDNSTEEDLKLYVDSVTKALDCSTAKPYDKSTLVKKMKLRPAADAEISRLLAMANQASIELLIESVAIGLKGLGVGMIAAFLLDVVKSAIAVGHSLIGGNLSVSS